MQTLPLPPVDNLSGGRGIESGPIGPARLPVNPSAQCRHRSYAVVFHESRIPMNAPHLVFGKQQPEGIAQALRTSPRSP
jgi:hypothetical protein